MRQITNLGDEHAVTGQLTIGEALPRSSQGGGQALADARMARMIYKPRTS